MINCVVLVGRLTRDPEVRYTQSGIAVCSFSIAVDRNYKTQSGERETDFINCTAWRKAGELIGQYMSKGSQIGIQGNLRMNKYQDKDGNNRTTYEVVVENFQFLDSKGSGGGGGSFQAPQTQPGGQPQTAPPPPPPPGFGPSGGGMEAPPDNMMEDDLPF